MSFLWVTSTLDPTSGGSLAAITLLIVALEEMGHQWEVVTLDDKRAPWIENFPGIVHALGPSWGKYRYNTRLTTWLYKNSNRDKYTFTVNHPHPATLQTQSGDQSGFRVKLELRRHKP